MKIVPPKEAKWDQKQMGRRREGAAVGGRGGTPYIGRGLPPF